MPQLGGLIRAARERIDLLDDYPEHWPERDEITHLLGQKAAAGCRIRILSNGPGHWFEPLFDRPRIEIRANFDFGHSALYRADETILLSLRLDGPIPIGSEPVLLIHRHDAADLFDRFAEHLETVWTDARDPIRTSQDLIPYQSNEPDDWDEDDERDETFVITSPPPPAEQTPTATNPPSQLAEPTEDRPRRWPRRPT